ncbi:MAG: hypothetical protein COC17_00345 [Hyphomicrobiales bacterium]|nr:hypothetical protein [Hyphomicrobiales bacterium]PCH51578.1 MAG: hypothetical protein COC17_00345 [Hyphomicrobiales bacterium]
MSFLKKLFGGGSRETKVTIEPIEYKNCFIVPTPMRDGGQFRICGKITKVINGENKEHTLIRADTLPSLEQANEMTIRKAKQVIDEQGNRIFG